jgi:hypothetical protein
VVSESRSTVALEFVLLSTAMTQTRSASAEVREVQDGLQLLHVVASEVQANVRQNQSDVQSNIRTQEEFRRTQEDLRRTQDEMLEMLTKQNEQFRQISSHFKFKERECIDANGGQGETSRNADPVFQVDSFGGEAFQTRSLCLDFPRFDGEDPEGWCYRASQFFDYYCISDAQRFTISSFHMEGKALV